MEEQKKYEELKGLLAEIQKTVQMYNELNPNEKLVITKEEPKRDVRNVFICAYDGQSVGFFERINYSSRIHESMWSLPRWDSGIIYKGIDSDYVGMKETHLGSFYADDWQQIGTQVVVDGESFVANCQMQDAMSFDDMRFMMYQEGKIGSYEIGKASSQEMLEVLKYAYDYFQISQNISRKKENKID